MEFDKAGMARTEPNESVLLCKGGLQFIMTSEVAFVENFNRVFFARSFECSVHNLARKVSVRPTNEGDRTYGRI